MPLFEAAYLLRLPGREVIRHFPPLDLWLRLNPQCSVLDIKQSEQPGRYSLHLRDEQSEPQSRPTAHFEEHVECGAWHLELADIAHTLTLDVHIQEIPQGTRLVYREEAVPETAQALRTNLALWHRSTAGYIQLAARKNLRSRLLKYPLDRIWLRMSQPGRRIVFFVIVSELAALALVLLWVLWGLLFGY